MKKIIISTIVGAFLMVSCQQQQVQEGQVQDVIVTLPDKK